MFSIILCLSMLHHSFTLLSWNYLQPELMYIDFARFDLRFDYYISLHIET